MPQASSATERELLDAARARRRGRLRAARRAPPRRAARPLLPDARLAARRRGRAPGHPAARLARPRPASRAAARCAPGSTGSPPTPASTRSRGGPSACCRSTTAPRPAPTKTPASRSPSRSGWSPIRTRASASRTATRRPRPATSARGGRARLHRRAPAPAAAAARGADPARGSGLLGQGGRAALWRRRSPRSTAPSSAPASTVDERLPEQSQQATLRSLGDDAGPRAGRALHRRLRGRRRRRDPQPASRGRHLRHAALSGLVPAAATRSPDSWLMPGGPPPRLRYVPARANGQLALGTYAPRLRQRPLSADRARRAHPAGRTDRGDPRLSRYRDLRPLRPSGRAAPAGGGVKGPEGDLAPPRRGSTAMTLGGDDDGP